MDTLDVVADMSTQERGDGALNETYGGVAGLGEAFEVGVAGGAGSLIWRVCPSSPAPAGTRGRRKTLGTRLRGNDDSLAAVVTRLHRAQ